MERWKALGVSPGIAIARLVIVDRAELIDPECRGTNPSFELEKLRTAQDQTQADLQRLRDQTRETVGTLQAEIFEAHLAILVDPELHALMAAILDEGWDAATAIYRACQSFIDLLSDLDDETMRSRADDVRDLRRRWLSHLHGAGSAVSAVDSPCILIADDLTPSETAGLDLSFVKGFVTASGSRTSHASILARSRGLPAIAGAGEVLAAAQSGQWIAIDGSTGEIVLDPSDEVKGLFESAGRRFADEKAFQKRYASLGTQTADGHHIDLAANIGRLEDLKGAVGNGAEAIGLFRTEFLFLDRERMPTEDEQAVVYRHIVEGMGGKPVVIRTLDIGGDKTLPYLPQEPELNPFLGVRAIRLCLDKKDLFRIQIRALLRASPAGDLRIMVPMVALVDEVRKVRSLFDAEARTLRAEGIPVGTYELGIMVEIPAAALNAAALAKEADFFSLGTNDLIQYTFAADRMNDRLAHLYQPLHPAILRLIDSTVQGASTQKRWVGVCGEMASDVEAAVLLVGLGVDELSLSAAGIPGLRAKLSLVSLERARETARLALPLGTSEEVLELVKNRHPELYQPLSGVTK